jgi:hypothetical protein
METRVTRVEEEVIPAIQMEPTLARAQITTTPEIILQVVKERIILEGLPRRLAQLPS